MLPLIIKDNRVGTATVRTILPVAPAARPELDRRTQTDRRAGKKADREGDEQTQLICEFALASPEIAPLLIHIPNGGSRANLFEGYRLRRQGVRAGVSDLLLPVARGGYFGLWIEFKAAPPFSARVSPHQKAWIKEMHDQGYAAEICCGVDAALDILQFYLQKPPTLPAIPPAETAK